MIELKIIIMPTKGQIFKDRFSGDTFEFLETAADTQGERVTMRITLYSKGPTVDDHIHLIQDEHFKVLSGTLTCKVGGKVQQVGSGEEVLLGRDCPHNHYNTSDTPVEYVQTISPALDIDYFLENLFGLINDGKVKNGKLEFLQAMVTLKYLESPSLLANLPRRLQRGLPAILAPVARLFGYRAIYTRYTGIEK